MKYIEYLHSSNKELFHSKSIGWMINDNDLFGKRVVNSITGIDKGFITEVKAITEISQIDILVFFKLKNGNIKFIHIENKINASEHYKSFGEKDSKKLGIDSKNKTNYSQTEYYYLRVKNRLYSNDFVKKVEKEFNSNETELKEDNWYYVFLTPSNYLNDTQQNSWNLDGIKNKWRNISYKQLIIDNCNDDFDDPSIKQYLQFLNQQFKIDHDLHKGFLSKVNVDRSLKDKLKLVEKGHLKHCFLSLKNEIKEKIKDLNLFEKKSYDVEFKTEAGNGRVYLLQFFFITYEKIYNGKSKSKIGIQFEHKERGPKIKFFVSAYDYDTIKIEDCSKEQYHKNLQKFFGVDIYDNSNRFQQTKNFFIQNFDMSLSKVSTPKGKTFGSLLSEFKKDYSYDSLIKVFIDFSIFLKYDLEKLCLEDWNILMDKIKIKRID